MKKLISLVFTVLMLSSLAIPALASGSTVGYNASLVTADSNFASAVDLETLAETSASGYDSDKGFSPTLLASTTYFYIDSVEGWNLFAKIVACGDSIKVSENPYSFYGKTVYLKGDIDFAGASAEPIGENNRREKYVGNGDLSAATPYQANNTEGTQVNWAEFEKSYFSGTFDGRGYSIKNLDMVSEYATAELGAFGNAIGLFKVIRGDATIKNLVIDADSSFINNCSKVSTTNKNWAGRGNIVASLAAYAITNTSEAFGDSKGFTIENVISNATVTCVPENTNRDYRYNVAAGLVAVTHVTEGRDATTSSSTIKNSTFAGQITQAGWGAAGILAHIYQANAAGGLNITNCLNSGNVTANGYVGGILGFDLINNKEVVCSITGCENSGALSNGTGAFSGGTRYTGAIIGADVDPAFTPEDYVSHKRYTITNCKNTNTGVANFNGNILTTAIAISGCTNNGQAVADSVFGENDTTGGIVTDELTYEGVIGYNKDAVVAKDLTNVAPICGFL
ncbi:MAG: hypothetical protein IKJ00_02200, partial [Clostridia bacterium]|nr:hypothetical protein [Clostridia bacterium]